MLLGVLGALIGALVGWLAQPALFRAEGRLHFEPYPWRPHDVPGGPAFVSFSDFVAAQVRTLESPATAQLALATKTWLMTNVGTGPEALSRFLESRQVLLDSNTNEVRIHFIDPRPDVALAGVRALMEVLPALADQTADDARIELVTAREARVSKQFQDAADGPVREGLRSEADRLKAVRDQLKDQHSGGGRVTIIDPGSLPSAPERGARPASIALLALLGAFLGAQLAISFGSKRGG